MQTRPGPKKAPGKPENPPQKPEKEQNAEEKKEEEEDDEESIQSHHPEDLTMFSEEERREWLGMRRANNPMNQPEAEVRKNKCFGRGRWRTDLCCLWPAAAVITGTGLMIPFCNGAFDCRTLPEGFTDDAENWTEEQWMKFMEDEDGSITKFLEEHGDDANAKIARSFYEEAGDFLFEFLRDNDEQAVRSLYKNSSHIFTESSDNSDGTFLSIDELIYMQKLLKFKAKDSEETPFYDLITQAHDDIATKNWYRCNTNGDNSITYNESLKCLDHFIFDTRAVDTVGGSDLTDGEVGEFEKERAKLLDEAKKAGNESMLKYLKTAPSFKQSWDNQLDIDGQVFQAMERIVSTWDGEQKQMLLDLIKKPSKELQEILEYFWPQDMENGWNAFVEILLGDAPADALAEAEAEAAAKAG